MSRSKAWKTAEAKFATELQAAAGRVTDPTLDSIVTSTGRVGHLTDLRVDFLAGNGEVAFVGEAKRRLLPAWLREAMLLLMKRSHEFGRKPIFAIQFSKDVPLWLDTTRGKLRVNRNWMMVPWSYGMQLVLSIRFLEERAMTDPQLRQDWNQYKTHHGVETEGVIADE